jgi:hypothetical protein
LVKTVLVTVPGVGQLRLRMSAPVDALKSCRPALIIVPSGE